MRKLIASLLLSIHLFNLGGYHLLYQYFIYQSDRVMNEHIAHNMYNVHDLVEVKVPVHFQNITEWTDYQPVSGQIQFREACYNYVKLKITRDTLFVKCIPNYEKTRLINANVICAKNIADLPVSKRNNFPSQKKSGIDYYDHATLIFSFIKPVKAPKAYNIRQVSGINSALQDTPYMPPDSFC